MNMDIKLTKPKIALFLKTLFLDFMYKAVTRYNVKKQKAISYTEFEGTLGFISLVLKVL